MIYLYVTNDWTNNRKRSLYSSHNYQSRVPNIVPSTISAGLSPDHWHAWHASHFRAFRISSECREDTDRREIGRSAVRYCPRLLSNWHADCSRAKKGAGETGSLRGTAKAIGVGGIGVGTERRKTQPVDVDGDSAVCVGIKKKKKIIIPMPTDLGTLATTTWGNYGSLSDLHLLLKEMRN